MPRAIKRRLTPAGWLKGLPPADPADLQTQSDFLDLHWQYGAQIHSETAKVLVQALRAKTTMATGHSLYLRLFSEYVNSLELIGAWGWVFRERRGQWPAPR